MQAQQQGQGDTHLQEVLDSMPHGGQNALSNQLRVKDFRHNDVSLAWHAAAVASSIVFLLPGMLHALCSC